MSNQPADVVLGTIVAHLTLAVVALLILNTVLWAPVPLTDVFTLR